MSKRYRLLLVDDEEFNLKILSRDLGDNGYNVVLAQSGNVACDILKNDADFDAILLDRMMPNMNGIEVMNFIRNDARVKHIPVIMQTALAATKEIIEGISSGVFYYLTKPYEVKVLLAIVRSAIKDSSLAGKQRNKINNTYLAIKLIECAEFHFRTLEDAAGISTLVSHICPNLDDAYLGISALIVNAIEHGNLGITYKEKTELLLSGLWEKEINNRLQHKEFIDKVAYLKLSIEKGVLKGCIEDMGSGFDCREYMELDPHRVISPNGRGIAISKMVSFDSLEYLGNGSKAIFTINLNKKDVR